MKTILFFGTFDPLHDGHLNAFASAKALGDRLLVVVARDSIIRAEKHREPHINEQERRSRVAAEPDVDEAILGDSQVGSYNLIKTIPFDILALGYDQKPSDEEVAQLLQSIGLSTVQTFRLPAFYPDRYKSSLFRSS